MGRLVERRFGQGLTAHFASRFDQIHFKLFAFVDLGGGRHEQDLRALRPTHDELVRAARWVRTQDRSPAFGEMLGRALLCLGVDHADL